MGDVRAVLHLLASAERPVILAGAGVLRARCSNDLVRFAELLHVPVVAAWRRGDVIPNDHPLYLGMSGYGSPAFVRDRIRTADALLVIGSPAGRGRPPAATRSRPPGSAGSTSTSSRARAPSATRPRRSARSGRRPCVPARAVAGSRTASSWRAGGGPVTGTTAPTGRRGRRRRRSTTRRGTGPGVHPGRIIADLRRLLPDDAILTTDAGTSAAGRRAGSGSGVRAPSSARPPAPWATGSRPPSRRIARPPRAARRRAVGDGGMGMTLAEVETAVREGAHVIAIVFDNEQYGMIHMHQVREGSPTRPGPTSAHRLRRRGPACGARGVRVDTDAGFEPALRTALAASGPTVIQLASIGPGSRWTSRRRRDGPRMPRLTLHLVPEAVWTGRRPRLAPRAWIVRIL